MIVFFRVSVSVSVSVFVEPSSLFFLIYRVIVIIKR